MKVRILIDNRVEEGSGLACEHGLAMYVECDGGCFLVDTGESKGFLENSLKMGVDLSAVDFCVISHGHDDHTGGLRGFLELESNAKVIASSDIFTNRYFSKSRGDVEEIGVDRGLLDEYLERFNCLDTRTESGVGEIPRSSRGMTGGSGCGVKGIPRSSRGMTGGSSCGVTNGSGCGVMGGCGPRSWWVTPDIALVKCGCDKYPRPGGNKTLFKSGLEEGAELVQDDFSHELSVAVKCPDGVVIISSCSHCGAANIIESCMEVTGESRLCAFIGGLHFTDRSDSLDDDVAEFVKYIQENHPNGQIYTGHCTGEKGKGMLSLYNNIHFFKTGDEIIL